MIPLHCPKELMLTPECACDRDRADEERLVTFARLINDPEPPAPTFSSQGRGSISGRNPSPPRRILQYEEDSGSSQGRTPLFEGLMPLFEGSLLFPRHRREPGDSSRGHAPESSSSRQRLPVRSHLLEPAVIERGGQNARPRAQRTQDRHESQDCPICTDRIDNGRSISRCHVCEAQYHKRCLQKWFAYCRDGGNDVKCPHW